MSDDHSVEALLETIDRAVSDQTVDFDLTVPARFTLRGIDLPGDAAMAIMLDTLLGKGLMPAGFTERADGRTYHYRRETPH
jgi:hypothetical protein